MSLLLHKVCQPVLDSYGLGHLHTTEIDYTKVLKCTTECGEDTFKISSIKFTKQSPNIPEIKYAAVLLEEYLAKNKLKVDAYLKAKAAFNKCPIFEVPENITLKHNYDGLGGVNRIVNYNDKTKLSIIIIQTKKKSYELSVKTPATLNKKEVVNYTPNSTLLDSMLSCLSGSSKKADLRQAAKDALAELSTCTI